MRYMNWDVLIFPETGETKTPLQEFATACTVVQDPALDNTTVPILSHSAFFKPVTHPLPTVSCFVPSLLPGSPFKVSLHSWTTPAASRATQTMAAQGNSVWFEAKVLLDGVCSAGILFSQDSNWPQIVDESHSVDEDGKHEPLHFPPFHQELLTQIWANPAQGMGTVRVVIAEGINQGRASSVSFVKLRNIVTFAFQHAPLHILENCAIAWPNPGMWWQGQQQFHNHTSQPTGLADAEAHAHSPRCQQNHQDVSEAQPEKAMTTSHISQELVAHPAFRATGILGNDPFWSQHGPMHDPFTGAATSNSFYKTVATYHPGELSKPSSRSTSTSHDESMPDYSRPLSPVSSRRSYPMPDYSRPATVPGSRRPSDLADSAIYDFGFSRLDSMLQSHQAQETENQFEDLIAAFSPRKHSSNSGISAPSNTRVNSAANTPQLKPSGTSAAAKERVSSYASHPRSVSVTTRDPHLPHSAQASCNGKKSTSSAPWKVVADMNHEVIETKSQSETVVKKRPIGRPRGRKEGKTSEAGGSNAPMSKVQRNSTLGSLSTQGKENESMGAKATSDGKRRRASNIAGSKVALEDRLTNYDGSSPTRKVSKVGPQGSPCKDIIDLDDLTAEGVVTRAPLGELENCL